jgi:signal transduction histidine kinase/DNA-binding response OmpR family regulator
MRDDFKGNILIVDDTPVNLRLLAQMLSNQGYKVRPVIDGPQALTAARSTPPDLILLDIMMPGMSGYEVCERLKADEHTREIPVIFISALDVAQDKVRAFAVGGVDYITKPFQVPEVLARVETHLAVRNLHRRLEDKLVERETLIAKLDTVNAELQQEIAEREQAQRKLQVALARSETLYRIARSMIAYENLSAVLKTVTDSIAQAMPANCVILITFDADAERKPFRLRRFVKGGPGSSEISVPSFEALMDGLVGWVWRNVQPVLSVKERADPRDGPAARRWRVAINSGAIIVTPLYYQDRMLGALMAVNRPDERNFGREDLTLLTAMASQMAIALETAQAKETLRRYAADLEAQNAELDAFAHTVAHDLKNPLTSLIGFSALLERRFDILVEGEDKETDTDFHESLQYALQAINRSAYKMRSIIDELLLLSSVRGMESVEIQPLDMAYLTNEAQSRLAYAVEESQAEIVVPEHWPTALGHGPWIEEVWANYISNAIKYGGDPEHGVPPRIELGFGDGTQPPLNASSDISASISSSPYIRFWVRDNGPGLTSEAKARLFTPFERLHQVRAQGHGLGLSIVQRIVEKLGGEVGVESQVGQGSEFFFTLPTADDS